MAICFLRGFEGVAMVLVELLILPFVEKAKLVWMSTGRSLPLEPLLLTTLSLEDLAMALVFRLGTTPQWFALETVEWHRLTVETASECYWPEDGLMFGTCIGVS